MAYTSKNSIFKSKEFWVGFLVAVIVFVGLGELQRSNNRAAALVALNKNYATLKTDRAKVAAIFTANTIIADNKSWFDFSNSNADEWDNVDVPMLFEDGGPLLGPRGAPDPQVTTSEAFPGVSDSTVWMNPETGKWEGMGCSSSGC